MNIFRSNLHDVYTKILNKVALSHYDDKGFVIQSTSKTLPWSDADIDFLKSEPEPNLENLLRIIEILK